MTKINWDKFKVKNEDYRKSFEELAYFLFCRKFKRTSGIFRYKNQTGIETEPILEKNKWIGFQAKWFESKIDQENIKNSVEKAKDKNPKLSRIIFYINQEFSESREKGRKDGQLKKDIESHAKELKIEIEWVVRSNFEQILNQPANLDLAQLYFDFSDEFGFVKSCSDPKILTFLQSSEYIELPFINSKTEKLEDITKKILKAKQKDFLITGHPGSGKSISIHKLFQVFAGLDKNRLDDVKKVLQKNKAVPMLINLKNCTFDTIENLIRNRQNDYKVRNGNAGFIYLLDGLDELSAEKADHVLLYLYELEKDDHTKKIILSCRSGNLNKVKVKTYFTNITEYKISDLTKNHIDKYFKGKNDSNKNKLFQRISNNNKKLLSEIKDILLVKLFWDTIENLNQNSTILDLLDKKVKLLISEPQYAKNIEELNLLNPKENKLIELNKEISFHFQKKFQFRLAQKEIQKIILIKYPRIDYKSANTILNYIATLFFDGYSSPSPDESDNSTFVYQHRRYQDFFFIQHLTQVYENNPKVLREFKILSNRDFFENLFLYYLRNEYTKNKNLPGIIELNLIEVYLGNRNDFGADDPYYQNSSEFIPSLAIQDKFVLQELLADESLNIKEKISFDLNEIKNKFTAWEKEKDNYRLNDYLKGIWTGGIAFLLENIVIFWISNKQEVANELRKILNEILELFKKYKFRENLKKDEQIDDPFWKRWEDYLYFLIVIKKEKPSKIFNDLIRGNYKNFEGDENKWAVDESGKDKLVKSFFRVCINSKQKSFLQIIEDLDNEEILMLIDVLVSDENIPLLIKNRGISQKLKNKIANINTQNTRLLFCKTIYNQKIDKSDKDFLEKELETLRDKRQVDWHMYKTHIDYAVVSYILNQNSFTEYLKPQKGHPFKYYNELGLYAALFRNFVEMLRNKKKIEAIARDYMRFVNFYTEGVYNGKYLKVDMSFLWAHIFASSKEEPQKLLSIKNSLIAEENNLVQFSFCLKLQNLDKELFVKLINKSELQIFENKLKDWDDDFPSYVSHCFDLASFFADIDKQKAITYIAKGINESMIRHGWHKDTIVSYLLVDALEILWRNNWASREELKEYTKRIFELTYRVSEVTDGDHTWCGPYNVIDLTSKYDTGLAIELKDDLKKKKGSRNFSNAAISSILSGKVKQGLAVEEIEEGMNEYKKDYRYDSKPNPDYYEQKFRIYLEIAQSDFYTKDERKKAFENAYQQVEEMKKENLDYFLMDIDFKEIKQKFVKLCEKYKKKVNVTFDKKEEYHQKTKISESDFIKELKQVKNKQKITGLYKKLNNYHNGIVLANPESWRLLVEKTYSVCKDIRPFIGLLKKNSFPHTDWFTSNSKYFHLGLGAVLENINTKEEIMNYLFDKTTGHGGFVNVMRSYEIIGNREMCLKLFRRYLRFCDFLVN